MDQKKIGKFIATIRKEKKMTQGDLAEKLGVTDRAISNWENGKNMPDLSLFKPLCQELDITINDLISGEKVDDLVYQEKLEENIISTIDYSNKRILSQNNIMGLILTSLGILIALTSIAVFPSESSWGSIYSVFGVIISLIGISRFTKRLTYFKSVICNLLYFIVFLSILIGVDYLGVINIHQAPRFSFETISENGIYYNTLFYDVYRCDVDTDYETFNVTKNDKYNREYCNVVRANRLEKLIEKAKKETATIELSVGVLCEESGESYFKDHNYDSYLPKRTIKNKDELIGFLKSLSNVGYSQITNSVRYNHLFQVYDKDNNLILEFSYNWLYDSKTKETYGIYFDMDTKKKLENYFE